MDQQMDEDTAVAKSRSMDQQRAADRQQAVAAAAPEASEPLTHTSLVALHTGIAAAVDALLDGQVPVPPEPQGGEDVMMLPPELFVPADALGKGLQQLPAGQQYAFNAAEMATTNDGVIGMGAKLKEAAKDKALLREVKGGRATGDAKKPAPGPEDTTAPAPPAEDMK